MKTELRGASSVALRRQDGGYCADGPGFYIWDEDPDEVIRVARDLERGLFPRVPTQRLLLVHPPDEPRGRTEREQARG